MKISWRFAHKQFIATINFRFRDSPFKKLIFEGFRFYILGHSSLGSTKFDMNCLVSFEVMEI